MKKGLLFLLPVLMLCACTQLSKPEDILPPVGPTKGDNTLIGNRSRASAINTVGLAAIKEFEKTSQRDISRANNYLVDNNDESDDIGSLQNLEQLTHYTYPFDYVKIHSAIKFSITIFEDATSKYLLPLTTTCGYGDLEIIIADFSTYIGDEKLVDITDRMITFKGTKGVYTILSNSGSYQYTNEEGKGNRYSSEIFSSHKTITNTGVEKEFQPPYYGVQFRYGFNGNYDISFAKSMDGITSENDFDNANKYSYDYHQIVEVSRNTVYSIHDLTSFEEKSIKGNVTSIDKEHMYFTLEMNNIESMEKLIYFIYINEYTQYVVLE